MSIGKLLITTAALAGIGGLVYACSGPINSALNDLIPSPGEWGDDHKTEEDDDHKTEEKEGRTVVELDERIVEKTYENGSLVASVTGNEPSLAVFFVDSNDPTVSLISEGHVTDVFGDVLSYEYVTTSQIEEAVGSLTIDVDSLVPEGYGSFADYAAKGHALGFYCTNLNAKTPAVAWIREAGEYHVGFTVAFGGGNPGIKVTER